MQHKRVPIGQVAQAAGVSAQTVSRVINKQPGVSAETRRRVLEVISDLGYRPSRAAQALRGGGRTIGVVGFGLDYYGPSRTLVGVGHGAQKFDYELILELVQHPEHFEAEQILDKMKANHVNGIVWGIPHIGENVEAAIAFARSSSAVPIIFTDVAPQPDISGVIIDNYLGGQMATRHFIDQGHTVIAHLLGPQSSHSARMRKAAWAETLSAKQPGCDVEALSCEGDWSAQSGAVAFETLMRRRPDITAIFAGNDQMALGALYAANRMGLRVPQDVAIIGYDDIPEAPFFQPALSSVRQNVILMGISAVEALVRQIEQLQIGEAIQPHITWIKPELSIRDSSLYTVKMSGQEVG